jgi:LuxR family maltose regulon positive regulatory protein
MAEIISLRASRARLMGQGREGIQLSERALALTPHGNQQLRGITQINLAASYGLLDDLGAAERALDAADAHAHAIADPCVALIALTHRAFVQNHRGRLHEAERLYREALRCAIADGNPPFPAAAYAYLGLGELAHQRNELEAAQRHLMDSITLGEGGRFNISIAAYMCLARVKQAQGDDLGADEASAQARKLADDAGVTHMVSSVDARRVLSWLQQGKLAEAERWACQRPADIPISTAYLDDAQDITVARVWLATGKARQARALLDQLLAVAERAGRVDRSIELLALLALAHAEMGDEHVAVDQLRQALTFAEPGGYVRAFIEAGPGVAPLVRRVLEQRGGRPSPEAPSETYLRALLAAFARTAERQASAQVSGATTPNTARTAYVGSNELLSARELEVLRCSAAGASNQQIATELYVTVGTIKRHLHNIFGKLDATSRTKAIARARELGLIDG